MAIVSEPLTLPPSPFVKSFASEFAPPFGANVLDIGCSSGRNSIYFAKLGHRVIGYSLKFSEISEAARSARDLNLSCNFLVGDACAPMLRARFDVVLINEVLHLMDTDHSQQVIQSAQQTTNTEGLHAVSGYLVDPSEPTVTRTDRYFMPGDLYRAYPAEAWDVLAYEEQATDVFTWGGEQQVRSLATIIARKRG